MIVLMLKYKEIKITESYSNTKTVIKISITSYFTYRYEMPNLQGDATAAVFPNQEKKYSLLRQKHLVNYTHLKLKLDFFFLFRLIYCTSDTLRRLPVLQRQCA